MIWAFGKEKEKEEWHPNSATTCNLYHHFVIFTTTLQFSPPVAAEVGEIEIAFLLISPTNALDWSGTQYQQNLIQLPGKPNI